MKIAYSNSWFQWMLSKVIIPNRIIENKLTMAKSKLKLFKRWNILPEWMINLVASKINSKSQKPAALKMNLLTLKAQLNSIRERL